MSAQLQTAWQQINFIRKKKDAYQRLFLGVQNQLKPEAEIVLKDLYKYCRARTPIRTSENGAIDPLSVVAAAARKEVFDRIMHYVYGKDKEIRGVDLGTGE